MSPRSWMDRIDRKDALKEVYRKSVSGMDPERLGENLDATEMESMLELLAQSRMAIDTPTVSAAKFVNSIEQQPLSSFSAAVKRAARSTITSGIIADLKDPTCTAR